MFRKTTLDPSCNYQIILLLPPHIHISSPFLFLSLLLALTMLLHCNIVLDSSLVEFRSSNFSTPSWSLNDYQSNSTEVKLSRDDLIHLSNLSYLPYPQDDARLVKDVAGVIGWFDSITHLDLAAHQPMYTPLEIPQYYASVGPNAATSTVPPESPGARLRKDVVTEGGIEKAVLRNAPYQSRGFFVVPRSGKQDTDEDS